MDFDSIMGAPPKVRDRKRKEKSSKVNTGKEKAGKDKSKKRLGNFFSRKDSSKRASMSESTNLTLKAKENTTAVRLNRSTSSNPNNVVAPKRNSRAKSVQTNKLTDFSLENEFIYKLRCESDELRNLKRKQMQLMNSENNMENLISHITNTRDPLLNQEFYNPNPYHNKELVKSNIESKRLDKLLESEKKKPLSQRDTFTIYTVIAGSPIGQSKFWAGVDAITKNDDAVRKKYRKPFITAVVPIMANAIHSISMFNDFDSISKDNQERVDTFLAMIPEINTTTDLVPIIKTLGALWKEPALTNMVNEALSFDPNRDSLLKIFSMLTILADANYKPTLEDYHLLTAFTDKAEVSITVGNLNFKFIGTDRFNGKLIKYCDQFEDNDILVFWADVSTPDLAKKSYADLLIYVDKAYPKLCAFVLFFGLDSLNKIATQEDLSTHFIGYKEGDLLPYLDDKFQRAILTKGCNNKPSFKIFTEVVETLFDVNIVLKKTQDVLRAGEQERVLDLAM